MEKPFFWDAFRRTRCLVPASGYYDWRNTATGKQPRYFTRADRYPHFYLNSISENIQTAIRYLNVSSSGRQWIASLYSNVFRAERDLRLAGPQR